MSHLAYAAVVVGCVTVLPAVLALAYNTWDTITRRR